MTNLIPHLQSLFPSASHEDCRLAMRDATVQSLMQFAEVPRDEVAIAGPDGRQVARLLGKVKEEGSQVLSRIAATAISRAIRDRGLMGLLQGSLFNANERARLAAAITRTNTTANLLGRSQVRERMRKSLALGERFNELAPFTAFREEPLPPVAPIRAIQFFAKLVPMVGARPEQFIQEQRQIGFTLAGVTEDSVLRQVQRAVLRRLETGAQVSDAPSEIQAILDAAGLSPRNPQRAEQIFRTNMMVALNTGIDEERREPDVAEAFPTWRYLGVLDGREGDDHRPHFGLYFPANVPFDSVRGPRVYNCRCSVQPVSRAAWRRLKARGVKIAPGYPDVAA